MPGKTGEVEAELEKLAAMVVKAGEKDRAFCTLILFQRERPTLFSSRKHLT